MLQLGRNERSQPTHLVTPPWASAWAETLAVIPIYIIIHPDAIVLVCNCNNCNNCNANPIPVQIPEDIHRTSKLEKSTHGEICEAALAELPLERAQKAVAFKGQDGQEDVASLNTLW